MEAPSAVFVEEPVPARPAAILKGTARGLEAIVHGGAAVDAIALALTKRLDEAPSFFRGSDVRVRVEDGPLPAGCLARLDEIAAKYELRVVEVAPAKKAKADDVDAVPRPSLASGSAPATPPALPLVAAPRTTTNDFADDVPTNLAPSPLAAAPVAESALDFPEIELTELVHVSPSVDAAPAEEPTLTGAAPMTLAATPEVPLPVEEGTRIVVGPVRSGVILEHTGHLFVFGDVNPGAEVRATGNIVVLGRLRGTAHAGIGQDVGFILSLRLEPQQLRIARKVARAADSDTPSTDAEIAYCTGDAIVVERYLGKLPKNLATSL